MLSPEAGLLAGAAGGASLTVMSLDDETVRISNFVRNGQQALEIVEEATT